ncbi:MAG: hypothetical protein ACKVOE_10090 [Rickettsiales bacterium]
MHVMFDTNIFSDIINEQIPIDALIGKVTIYATHVQYDELNATAAKWKTPNGEPLREKFLELFNFLTGMKPTESGVVGVSKIGGAKVAGNVVPTESAVWDVSAWGHAKWGSNVVNTESSAYGVSRYGKAKYVGTSLCKEIWQKLDARNNKEANNSKDALIAETAIINGYVLITHDGHLLEVTKELLGNVMRLDELMQKIAPQEAVTV